MISYSYSWIWVLYGIALILFVIVLRKGLKNSIIEWQKIAKGAVPMTITLVVLVLMGMVFWPLTTAAYPWYNDILQGFPYNGYEYIYAVAFIALGICLLVYSEFSIYKTLKTNFALIAPIILWFLICGALNIYLKGATFFILPLFGLILAFWFNKEKTHCTLTLLVTGLPIIAFLLHLFICFLWA